MNIVDLIVYIFTSHKRKASFIQRNICNIRYNNLLAIGSLYLEEVYTYCNKERIVVEENISDIIRNYIINLIIIKIKLISIIIKSKKSQFIFCLYSFDKKTDVFQYKYYE